MFDMTYAEAVELQAALNHKINPILKRFYHYVVMGGKFGNPVSCVGLAPISYKFSHAEQNHYFAYETVIIKELEKQYHLVDHKGLVKC